MQERPWTEGAEGLVTRDVGFCYVLVRDTNAECMVRCIRAVLDAAKTAGGDAASFDASMVLVTFGLVSGEPEDAAQRTAFVHELAQDVGQDVAYVHGRREALVGSVGTQGRRSYTFLFTGLRECLRQLADLPFGSGRAV